MFLEVLGLYFSENYLSGEILFQNEKIDCENKKTDHFSAAGLDSCF